MILQPTKRVFDLGAGYALLAGLFLAFSLVLMRMTSRVEKFYSFVLYFFTIGAVVSAPFAILDWKIEGGLTLLGLLGMGLCSGAGQILLFYGLKFGKIKHLAPFTYSAVIFTGIYEWLIWGILPRPIAYVGIALIIAAGIWIVYVSRQPKIKS